MDGGGGLGSGVLISDDGKVLTATHVVQTAEKVLVEFADGSVLPAAIVASEPAADVALLQLAGPPPAGAHRAVLGVTLAGSDSYAEIRRRMADLEHGETLRVKVLREGRTVDLSAAWR